MTIVALSVIGAAAGSVVLVDRYQPRANALVSSEFGEPKAYEPGFDPEDVAAGRYGSRLHFWNLDERRLVQEVERLEFHAATPYPHRRAGRWRARTR